MGTRLLNIATTTALTILLAGVVSCQKESGDPGRKGREVRFGASSGYASGVATRTVYTGVDEGGTR